jgi:hypothetical protein
VCAEGFWGELYPGRCLAAVPDPVSWKIFRLVSNAKVRYRRTRSIPGCEVATALGKPVIVRVEQDAGVVLLLGVATALRASSLSCE